ncbi:MAG: hypothetical protein AAGE84_31595 [Cyanobacteria bacterium P01_G01_bin.39]
MAENKKSNKQQQQDSKPSNQEQAKPLPKQTKIKIEEVIFDEPDLWKVKYDF